SRPPARRRSTRVAGDGVVRRVPVELPADPVVTTGRGRGRRRTRRRGAHPGRRLPELASRGAAGAPLVTACRRSTRPRGSRPMTARPTPTEVVTRWWPEALLVVTVILAGLTDATYGLQYWAPSSAGLATSVVMAIAVALFRRVPASALAGAWLAGLLFVLVPGPGIPIPLPGAAAVAYGCARGGSRGVVWASGLPIPAAGVAGVLVVLVQQAVRSGILMPRLLIDSIYDL